ncbi:hypothetical protein PHLCEN_2v570 [Hermanssonia centrifuga]|uniref:Uncharacterized protein n=1 Tax=Hermanssonia centrifuga TaxID=98765 RepID=A0A2R6S5J5_9APHY|nr:hypothetical protein PHLCEN_2v570 [Hermanssonia centrifuga]
MKPRDYCCCAIPTVNAGIYITLLEQFTLGIVAGTLSVATPAIVGASTFSAAKWIFAIICYAAAAIQVLGFFGVLKERPIMYRRYTTLHLLVTLGAFSVAAVWIAWSAARHNKAKAKCQTDFFAFTSEASEAETLCNIFPWVDIGLMAGLWVLLAISQLYFYVVISSYGAGQRLDHEKYDSMYDPTNPLTSDIPLNNRGDAWDSRPSDDNIPRNGTGYHDRHDSMGSMDNIMDNSEQKPQYGGYAGTAYPPAQPGVAYTQDPTPTPHAQGGDYYSSSYDANGNMEWPERTQPHPGGS